MEAAAARAAVPAAGHRRAGAPRGGAVLLRLAGAPARRVVVGLVRDPRTLRARGRGGPQLLGLARRGLRPRGRDDELPRAPRGAPRRGRPARAGDPRALGPRRRGRGPLGGPRVRPAGAGSTTREEIVRFMDRYVRGLENGVERAPRVRAFVMGENVWRTGNTLPLEGHEPVSLYLAGGGKLAREAPAGERRRRAASSRTRPTRWSIPTPRPPGPTTTARSPGAPTRWSSRPSLSPSRSASSARSRRRSTSRPTRPTPTSGSSSRTSARTERPGTSRAPARTCCGSSERDGGAEREAARGGRDRRPAPPEPAHRQPLREGPSRARRALRQLHAALLAQPPDRRVRDALGEDAQGDDPHPPRRCAPLPDHPPRGGVSPERMTLGVSPDSLKLCAGPEPSIAGGPLAKGGS